MKKRIVVLGSTGSIGTQALEVIAAHPGSYELVAIAAGNNAELLAEQAIRFSPAYVAIGNTDKTKYLREAFGPLPIQVLAGSEGICQLASLPEADMVLTAMVGYAGLEPTLAAIKAGKNIALANKETLVVAGDLVMGEATKSGSRIYPVDSEHSAIFQCLEGEPGGSVEKLILTASGGPFRGKTLKELENVTLEQALIHPNWCMGNKITIDSATLMNKGLEVIEARWLFNIPPDQIEVVVHPQSIIHSMVQFIDGSIKAQMGLPDMRLPIHFAFAYPGRLPSSFERFSFFDFSQLTFEKPDTTVFRNLSLAYEAIRIGGNMPCILNAANEVAVDAFLKEQIPFLQIPVIVETAMQKVPFLSNPSYQEYLNCNCETRALISELIGN